VRDAHGEAAFASIGMTGTGLPALTVIGSVVAAPPGILTSTGHVGLILTFNDPFSCTKGYEGTHRRGGDETTDVPVNAQAYCAEPPGSPIGVRGSQNAPYGGKPPPAAVAPQQPAPGLPGSLSWPGDPPTTLAGLLALPT
jgi:phospholipid/cholesterol/gamma-HCH transport system substrate-binding protein